MRTESEVGQEIVIMATDDFVKMCQICGYASRKNAIAYAKSKAVAGEDLTEADFERVHSMNERKLDIKNGALKMAHIKTSGDDLLNNLATDPAPWNHIFDASRGVKR